MSTGSLPTSPAAMRNKGPIRDRLLEILPRKGRFLELASGDGQHIAHFAEAFPEIEFIPSDLDPNALPTIRMRSKGMPNVREPIALDARDPAYAIPHAPDFIYAANMIHISEMSATVGLLRGAALALPEGGLLITYGPYRFANEELAPSNVEFDRYLKGLDPRYCIRSLEELEEILEGTRLRFRERFAMPANNYLLVFEQGS